MKKRGFLSVIIVLILTISILGIILTANTPTKLLPNSPSNYLNPTAKSYTGSGSPLNALLYITNNTNSTANDNNTDNNIYIPCPNGWQIVWANLTLSNINAPNVTIEPNASSPNDGLDFSSSFYAMSFQLTNSAYLDNVSVMLTVDTAGTANFYVYNATNNGTGVPKPTLTSLSTISSVSLSTGTDYWETVDFSHTYLNTSNTYDETFFIAIQGTGSTISGRWRCIDDSPPPGAGHVYRFASGSWSSELNYDCKLNVNVSASTAPAESALPSEIGLTINGSQVSDISKGNGQWINSTASSVSTGYIFYDVNSTWMSTVSFSYIWNITCAEATYLTATTNFDVSHNSNASWNITVDATGAFPPTNGVNHINITGIPSDWGDNSSKAYNGSQWIALDSYPPNTVSFPASNDTWTVNCTAPNYVSSIGFEVGGETVENATLYDNLNINVTFNTTLRSNVSGTTTLDIYDFNSPQILNYTDGIDVNQATKTSFTWNVDTTTTSTGTYNVTISFKDGLIAGYNETSLLIVPLTNTSLTVTSYPPNVEYPGLVPITLYYNDMDNNLGVVNATITAYFANSTPATIQGTVNDQGNGYYSLNLNFSTDFGVHDMYFNAGGLRLYESSNSSTISINYTRILVGITIGFQVGAVPVINATLYDSLNITVNFTASVSGTVNLSIYDPYQILNYTAENTVSSTTSTWFIWNVSDNATAYGTYNVTISYEGALTAGYNETPLSIVPLTNTSLTVTSYPPSVQYSDLVPITLYYNDTDNNLGVAGANITAYFTNSTPATIQGIVNDQGNGYYSLNLTFGTDFGVHDVYFNAGGLRLYESSNSSTISIDYTRTLVNITIGFEVGGVPVANATLYDNNLNITVNFTASVSGNVNLSIYDPYQILNYTAENTVASATNTWFIWNVSNNATSTGTYNVTISLDGATQVGYNEKNLSIVNLISTSLTVISYPLNNVEYPGPVPITLFYNRTDTGEGLLNASIAAYEGLTPLMIYNLSDQGDGSYNFSLDFGTDFGVHNVYFNASNVRLFSSSVSSSISINYTKLLVNIQLNTPSSVVLGTNLVVTSHLSYTNGSNAGGLLVNFNFSIDLSNGTSTITTYNDTTKSNGLATGIFLVPIDTVKLNVTAFYIGTGTVFAATSSTNGVNLTSGGFAPSNTGLVALIILIGTQGPNLMLYLLPVAVIGVLAVVIVAADRARRSHAVPLKAMASLENIIVDHIPTGSTLWAFDFFKMEQDVTLVSGFMSAVKSFMGEMQKGGLRKLETEFGTFIREDGALLTATCITGGNTPAEENWIRQRLRSFVSIAEQQHLDELQKWSGDVAPFRKSFPQILASVIDLDKAAELHKQRISKMENEKVRLQGELNNLGSQLESLNKQFEAKEISKAEFEAGTARIEPEYDAVQKEYIRASLFLSRVPPVTRAKKVKPEVTEDVEKIQERFLKIRMEIEELRRKEVEGKITDKDHKRRDKLWTELVSLLEKLDKLQK